jgi:radical SAM superfamily enzyme YgiQ (UPF0313 family)
MILINPRSTKFGIFDKYVPLSVPIGVGHLAGYLQSRGKTVAILDEHVAPVTKDLLIRTAAASSTPLIFGISALTASIHRAYGIAGMIKELFPDSKIICGGIHPTVLPDEVLADPDIDIVVRGEGEEILDKLYEALKKGHDYSSFAGISFRRGAQVVHNLEAALPDLKKLPPFPYHIFGGHGDRYNFGFIASSRGCPYDCIFCSQRIISGHQFRYFPTELVIDEIDLLLNRFGQTHINFVDDNFTANRPRLQQLCATMIQRRFNEKATFDCQTRADAVNEEVLVLLKKAGFRLINFGLETSSERLMVLLNKKETVRQNVDAVRLAKKIGFGVSGTFIFGLPTETREDRWQAYRLAKDLDLDYVRFNNATPYPGTRLFEMARQENRLYIEEDWQNLNACATLVQDAATEARLPYVPQGTDERILKRDIVKANLYFSLRPARVIKLLLKRVGPAGWFYLPPRWYWSPREWFSLLKLGFLLSKSFLRAIF